MFTQNCLFSYKRSAPEWIRLPLKLRIRAGPDSGTYVNQKSYKLHICVHRITLRISKEKASP
jgi:hypothetical protein